MIEVCKILRGYYNYINNISLLPHIDLATRGNKYKFYQSSVKSELWTRDSTRVATRVTFW